MTLEEAVKKIKPLDEKSMNLAQKRWNAIAKPLHSLGMLEDMIIQMAGIKANDSFSIEKKAIVAMCADNGVVEEGVTQTGQEVTAIVAEEFQNMRSTVCRMCIKAGAALVPVDVGIAVDTSVRKDLKVAYGTRNFVKEPAMTREQAIQSIEAGIKVAEELADQGYQLLGTGEMGIGNTTTSSAMASVLLHQPVEKMTGKGAGLTTEGLIRKIEAIKKGISLHQPDAEDPIDVLAKVGGFDIGGMAGVFLGGAALQIPVCMDGFISCVAATLAARICPQAADYMVATHISKEPAARLLLDQLGKKAFLHADMCLGEGTGVAASFPFMDMGKMLYDTMGTFGDIKMDDYQELK